MVATVLSIIALLVSLSVGVLAFITLRRIKALEADLTHRLDDISLSHTISDLFSKNMGGQNMFILANGVFRKTVESFHLKAHSYSELVEEIKRAPNMHPKLREALVDFFEQIILISYKKDNLTDDEKEDLKRKVRLIMQIYKGS